MGSSFFINKPCKTIPNDVTSNILLTSQSVTFHQSLPHYKATPLIQLTNLAKKYSVGNIMIKDESHRFDLNAFKGLGASYAMDKLIKIYPKIDTFCTATDGNHGRAVAWTAQLFNKKAVVFVPKGTTKQRIQAIEKLGACVEVVNGNYDETCSFANSKSAKNNWQLIQDTAWQDYEEIPAQIMAGYLTLFQEIDAINEFDIDVVFLQAGVGSFAAAGIFHYLKTIGKNSPKIVIVEPTQADAILHSFQQGHITTSLGNSQTIMAGLNCGTPSMGAWELLKAGTNVAIKIDDEFSKKAMRELYYPTGNDKQVISGESGASGLAGFLAIMKDNAFKTAKNALKLNCESTILCINTEGITDSDIFNSIIDNTE